MEVLLVRRVERANDRSSGAFVFPGGTLDAQQDKALHIHSAGLDDAGASERLNLPANGLDFYLAAVRECFEEAGLLLAYHRNGDLLAPGHLDAAQYDLLRQAVQRGGRAWHTRAPNWACAWHLTAWPTTATGSRRRACPSASIRASCRDRAQRPDCDARWHGDRRAPLDPPGRSRKPAGGLPMMHVTRRTLQSIAHFETAQDCFASTSQVRDIACIMPRLAKGAAGVRPVMPNESCYAEIGRIDPDGKAHARYELRPASPRSSPSGSCASPPTTAAS